MPDDDAMAKLIRGECGYQPDGSYVPCPACLWEPPPSLPAHRQPPGVVIQAMSLATTHYGDCPTVPQISQETRDRLVEMDRVRRRGAAKARNFVIG